MEKIMDEQENFADKVIKTLRGSRSVDLTKTSVEPDITAQSNDFSAYAAPEGGGTGPGTGGNKDIVILPGSGGVAATNASQINFYWSAPSTQDLTGIGAQIRTTIFNYASTATSPLLVIGGYDGTTNFVPVPTYGTGGATGTTAKIFINPFVGYITQDYLVLNNTSASGAAIATTNAAGFVFYDNTQSKIRVGVGAGTAKTIAFTDDITAASGSAITAINVSAVTASTNADHFILFSPQNGLVGGIAVSSDTTLKYNPSTDVLTVANVVGTATTGQNVIVIAATTSANHPVMFTPAAGSVTGAATSTVSTISINPSTGTLSATTFSGAFSGNVTGNVTGFAQTARNVDVVAATTNAAHPITFTTATGTVSGAASSSVSTFTINPSTNAVSLGSGNLTANGMIVGSASNTINTSAGNLNIDSNGGTTNINDNLVVSGNFTVNGTTTTVDSTVSTLVDPIIVIGSGLGGTQPSVDDNKDRGIEFRYFSGTATTGFFGFKDSTEKFTFIPKGTNTGEVFSGSAGTAVFATVEGNLLGNVFGNVTGNLTGNVTGNVTGFAQTSRNVDVVAATTNTAHPVMFTPVSGSLSGAATSSVSTVTVNPSNGTVAATTFSGSFSGNVTGNVTGFAQTARNIDSVVATSAGNHFLLISPQTGVSGAAVSTDTNLFYVPSTDTLNVSTLSGVGVTVTASSALTNGTYFTIKTLLTDDNTNVDFFLRGTSSDNTSRFSIDTAGNLRATTKSFDIEHPTKPGKRLVYGALEGPEHGVYHRGTVEGKGKIQIELPEYWSKLVNEDYSIQLTSWGNYNVHIVEKTNNSFIIELTGNPFSQKLIVIKVDYVVHGSRIDAPLETEQ